MKTQLTKEQSQHLIDLGVPKEKAGWCQYIAKAGFVGMVPIFTLYNLLEILPKEIEDEAIVITHHNDEILKHPCWNAFYRGICNSHLCHELIDSLYEVLVWCLENKYLKF